MTQSQIFDFEYLLNNIPFIETCLTDKIVSLGDKLQSVNNAFHQYLNDNNLDKKQFVHYNQTYVDKTIERMRNFASYDKATQNSFRQDFKSDLGIDLRAISNLFKS